MYTRNVNDIISKLNLQIVRESVPLNSSYGNEQNIQKGERNSTMVTVAARLRNAGMDGARLYEALWKENLARCNPPLTEMEIKKIAKWGASKAVGDVSPAKGENANLRVVLDSQEIIRQIESIPKEASIHEKYKALAPVLKLIAEQPELTWKEYISAINKRFPEYDRVKLGKEIAEYSKAKSEQQERSKRFLPLAYVDQIRGKAPVISFDGKVYRYSHGVYSLVYAEEVDQQTINLIGEETQSSHLDAIRKFLNSVCFVRPETVNPRGILNLKNGLLNLESGSLEPHSPDILSTVQAETVFDPEATCQFWLQTIEEILPDPESRRLLAQVFGYCLTADCSYQKAFLFYGEGANGKSVITDVLEALVGRENCSALHLKDFQEKFRLAELQNRLINFATEVEAKGLINDARIKGVITGDPLTVERKNQPPFVIRPFVKLVVSCNNLPQTTDKSHGYFRRWIILPFPVTFSPDKWDRRRATTIRETELSGVLNWAIGGYKSLRDAGTFLVPSASGDALQEYRRQVDPTIDFTEDRLRIIPKDPDGTLLPEIYKSYRNWAGDNGHEILGRTNFRKAIERITGIKQERKPGGRFFPGIFSINC